MVKFELQPPIEAAKVESLLMAAEIEFSDYRDRSGAGRRGFEIETADHCVSLFVDPAGNVSHGETCDCSSNDLILEVLEALGLS